MKKVKKVGRPSHKIDMMIGLLTEPMTTDEIIERTGLSKGTVDLYVNYELKKKGYKIVKSDKLGRLAFQIEGKNDKRIHQRITD